MLISGVKLKRSHTRKGVDACVAEARTSATAIDFEMQCVRAKYREERNRALPGAAPILFSENLRTYPPSDFDSLGGIYEGHPAIAVLDLAGEDAGEFLLEPFGDGSALAAAHLRFSALHLSLQASQGSTRGASAAR